MYLHVLQVYKGIGTNSKRFGTLGGNAMTWIYEELKAKRREWQLLFELCIKYKQWELLDEYWKELWIMEDEHE